MTPQMCIEHCHEKGKKYAGLQYGKQCWCGNEYGKHGKVDDDKCDMPCSGDPDTMCGASFYNSIYDAE